MVALLPSLGNRFIYFPDGRCPAVIEDEIDVLAPMRGGGNASTGTSACGTHGLGSIAAGQS